MQLKVILISGKYCFFFFFFQAEDGIRDADVTGVQTCALPISDASRGVYQSDRCAVNPPARRIKHRAANRSSGGILGQSSCDEQENHADEAWHRADTWKWIKVSPDRGELGLYYH